MMTIRVEITSDGVLYTAELNEIGRGFEVKDATGARLCDAWWLGNEVIVTNGHLQHPVHSVLLDNVWISTDGVGWLPSLDAASIEYGCGIVYDNGVTGQEAASAFLSDYIDSGPSLDTAPLDALTQYVDTWGPWPDPAKTNATGSGRLFTDRVPGAVAATILRRNGHPWNAWAARRWVARQWQRGYHYYTSLDSVNSFWSHLDNEEWICSQGYNRESGGWSDLWGHKRPPGVTWSSSGDATPDPQHFAVDQPALYAALTGSMAGALDAYCAVEACASVMPHEALPGGRGFGHYFRGMAVTAPVCTALGISVGHWPEMLEQALSRLESRNVHGERGSWACLDWGKSSEGHLSQNDLESIAPFIEALGWTTKDAAKSANTWMSCVIVSGGDALLRFMDLPQPLVKRIWIQLEIAASSVVYGSQAEAYDLDAGAMRKPALVWDDVSPGVKQQSSLSNNDLPAMIASGDWSGWANGVGVRFCIAPLVAAYNRTGKQEALDLADKILENSTHYNGQSYLRWLLETWLPGSQKGWNG